MPSKQPKPRDENVPPEITPLGEALLLAPPAVAKLLSVSVRTLFGMRAIGAFPPPVVLPRKRVRRWRRADVESWVAALPVDR